MSKDESKIRIVASFTTLPHRYDVLRESMKSLKAQETPVDVIYLALPKIAARLKEPYPPLPQDIAEMCTVVSTDIDYGPITKVYGALVSEEHPDTIIISCDDDTIYPPDFITILVKHAKDYPNSSICGTGALIGKGLAFISIVSSLKEFRSWSGFFGFYLNKNGRAVDLVFGVGGVLYRRKFFPPSAFLHHEILQHALKDHTIFCNDDVLISGYLSKVGVERRLFYDVPSVEHMGGNNALSSDKDMVSKLNTSINRVKELGFYPTMEPVAYDETVFIKIVIAFIFLIMIGLLIFIWFKYYRF